jgi:predicted ATPase
MRINVSNIGPIQDAIIDLDSLTVFVGENGTGKSIVAKIIYGLLSFDTRLEFLFHKDKFYLEKFQNDLFGERVASLEDFGDKLSKLNFSQFSSYMKVIESDFIEYFNEYIPTFFNDDPALFSTAKVSVKTKTKLNREAFSETVRSTKASIEKQLVAHQANPESFSTRLPVRLFGFFNRLLTIHFYGNSMGDAFYLPAARSNFILTHKACTRDSKLDPKTNHFDKATDDFIKKLGGSQDDFEYLTNNVKDLENAFFNDGNLIIDEEKKEFSYVLKKSKQTIKWHNISSMIGEITPLVLTMRSIMGGQSVLIIDEPESHLHPHAQKTLIDHIAMAVNSNIRVIVITHSPYILSCINNLIKWGTVLSIEPVVSEVKKLLKVQPSTTALNIEIVKAYKFAKGKTKPIVNKKVNLIDESEFTEPFDLINEQYETMRNIEWNNKHPEAE